MVRFSIRKKFWKALGLLYQMMVETTGNDGNDEGNEGKWTMGETTVTSVAIRG